jgi:archaetidylinositol phosphate synthase
MPTTKGLRNFPPRNINTAEGRGNIMDALPIREAKKIPTYPNVVTRLSKNPTTILIVSYGYLKSDNIMLSNRRQRFSRAESVIGKRLSFLSANTWTALSIIFGLFAAYFIATGSFITGAVLFLIAAFCDAVDGAVARFKKNVSRQGAYLDTIVDRYVEFFIIIGLFFSGLPDFFLPGKAWLFVYMFGAMMTTYSRAAAKEKELVKEELRYGLLERQERMGLLFIGILLAALNVKYLVYIIALLAVLANITALQRAWKAMRG